MELSTTIITKGRRYVAERRPAVRWTGGSGGNSRRKLKQPKRRKPAKSLVRRVVEERMLEAIDGGTTTLADGHSRLERIYVVGSILYSAIDYNQDGDIGDDLNSTECSWSGGVAGKDTADAAFYYLTNRMGSVAALLDKNNDRKILEYYRYRAFGEMITLPVVDDGLAEGSTAADGLEDSPLSLTDNNTLMLSLRTSHGEFAGRVSWWGNEVGNYLANGTSGITGILYDPVGANVVPGSFNLMNRDDNTLEFLGGGRQRPILRFTQAMTVEVTVQQFEDALGTLIEEHELWDDAVGRDVLLVKFVVRSDWTCDKPVDSLEAYGDGFADSKEHGDASAYHEPNKEEARKNRDLTVSHGEGPKKISTDYWTQIIDFKGSWEEVSVGAVVGSALAGAAGGAVVGGAVGSAAPGLGTVTGAAGGAALGAVIGALAAPGKEKVATVTGHFNITCKRTSTKAYIRIQVASETNRTNAGDLYWNRGYRYVRDSYRTDSWTWSKGSDNPVHD